MSGGRSTSAFITPKEYGDNQAKIAAAQMYLESLTSQNEAGLRKFEELESQKRELQRKVEEGEKAKRVMDHLQNLQSNMTRGLLDGPRHEPYQGTARIEEVPLEDSVHNSTASHLQHAQRNPILSPLGRTVNHPNGGPSQPNLPYVSVPVDHDAQKTRIPMHAFAGQQQVVYPPPTIVLPETFPNGAAASLSQNRHSTQYPPFYQPQGSRNDLYNKEQPAQHVPMMNVGPSGSHQQQRHWGPSSVDQSRLPYGNTGQTVNPAHLPPGPEKPLEFVWDKDNSAEVRFLNILLSDIPLLKSKVSEFTVTAPLQTKKVIHPDMAVWKDQTSVVWLYIRVEGGFWRYRNIDQFFEGQTRLAKSYKETVAQGIQKANNKLLEQPYTRPTPTTTASKGISSTAKPSANRDATGTMSQQIVTNESGYTSTFRLSAAKVTPAPISGGPSIASLPPQNLAVNATGSNKGVDAATSASIAATPSNLAGSQPIDKKNLSKHILFALGKRPRDVFQRSPEAGRPTKKASLGTSAGSQTPRPTISVPAAQYISALSIGRPNANQPPKPSENITSTPNPATSTSTNDSVPATQSLPTEIITTAPQAASGDKGALIPNDKRIQTLPINPPAKDTTTSSSNATSPPYALVPPALVLVSHPISHNSGQSLTASQHVLPVAANAALQYRPHFAGSSQATQSGSLLPAAPTASGLTAIRPLEPSQAFLVGTSKKSQLAGMATNVGTLLQEQHRLIQQPPAPPKEPASSVALKQNVRQNADAGPSNVGTSREPLLPSAEPSATPYVQSGPADPKVSGKRRNKAYVLVPPRPPYLVAHKRRLAEKRAAHLLGEEGAKSAALSWDKEPGDTYDEPLIIGEDYSSGRNTPIDASERESLRLSATRIDVFPCRWDRCDVVLNCADSLLKHLNQHPPEPSPNNRSYTCRWTQCGRRCTYQEKHLENHAFLPLRCAYKNCGETFRTAVQLTKHFRSKHKNHSLKPTAELRQPELEKLPNVPGIIPGYLFVTKLVKPATISKNRHSLLVSNVVTNIVNSDPEKPVRLWARKAMRSTGGQAFPPANTVRNEYDFMTARSIRYSSYLSQPVDLPLSDLDSTNISELLDEGLMLWTPDGGSTNGDDGGDDVVFDRGDIKIEDGLQPGLEGPNAVSSISDRGYIEQRVDEEEMVANMLTQASG